MKKTLFLGLLMFSALTFSAWATSSICTFADFTTSKGFHDVRVVQPATITVTTTGADTTEIFDIHAYTLFALATKTSKSAGGDTARISWYPLLSADGTNWILGDSLVRVTNDTLYKLTKLSNWSGVPAVYCKLVSQGRGGNDTTTVNVKIIMQK